MKEANDLIKWNTIEIQGENFQGKWFKRFLISQLIAESQE